MVLVQRLAAALWLPAVMAVCATTILFAMVGGILMGKHGGRLGLPAPDGEARDGQGPA